MARRTARVLAALVGAAGLLVLAPQLAHAQTDTTVTKVDDPVGQGVHFIAPDIPASEVPDAGSVGGAGGGDASGGLAVTGVDVEPIVAISVGLLAVGGSAVVASRRRIDALS